MRRSDGKRVQIKGRAFDRSRKLGQRLGRIKHDADCDVVMLVMLDNATLEPWEILDADYAAVSEQLSRLGSKARERGAMAVAEFRQIGKVIWSAPNSEREQTCST